MIFTDLVSLSKNNGFASMMYMPGDFSTESDITNNRSHINDLSARPKVANMVVIVEINIYFASYAMMFFCSVLLSVTEFAAQLQVPRYLTDHSRLQTSNSGHVSSLCASNL